MEGTTEIKIRGYHLDGYQHVNHARYLELMEEARWQLFDEHPEAMATLMEKNLAIVVVNINIDYKAQAELGDTMRIHTDIKEVGGKSFRLHQQIYRDMDNTLVVDAMLTIVLVDRNKGGAQPIDNEIKAVLNLD